MAPVVRTKCAVTVVALAFCARPAKPADEKTFVNSIGMNMVRIEPGTFSMGFGATRRPGTS